MTGSAHVRRVIAFAAALLLAVFGVLLAQGLAGDAAAKAKGKKRVTLATKTYSLNRADQKQRLTVRCPHHKIPLGGGMSSSPPPSQGTGEGVYPHSYERLGVQHGYHVTAVLYDPSRGNTTSRTVTLQVLCGRKLGHMTPPHRTVYVGPGQTKSAVAKCPGRRHLIGGGFSAGRPHLEGRRLRHRVARNLREGLAGHRPCLRQLRRRADGDRLLPAQQEAAGEGGLGPDVDRPASDRNGADEPLSETSQARLRRLQHRPHRLDLLHERRLGEHAVADGLWVQHEQLAVDADRLRLLPQGLAIRQPRLDRSLAGHLLFIQACLGPARKLIA